MSVGIIAGLFPPAKADINKQHENPTSKEIIKITGNNNFCWIDLITHSPTGYAKDFDSNLLKRELKTKTDTAKSTVQNYGVRVMNRVKEVKSSSPNNVPVVTWSGPLVRACFDWLIELQQIEVIESRYFIGELEVIFHKNFISIIGSDHASYHLQCPTPKNREAFKLNFQVFEALRVYGKIPLNILQNYVDKSIVLRLAQDIRFFDILHINHNNGWLDENLRHLRRCILASNIAKYQLLREKVGHDTFILLCTRHINAHIDEPDFIKNVIYFFEVLGKKKFASFAVVGVLSRLSKPSFCQSLNTWLKALGPKKFPTFMCNGVAARLEKESFEVSLNIWLKALGPKKFATFMCGGVAARLEKESFEVSLNTWLKTLGPKKFPTFMCDQVAINLGKKPFDDKLNFWLSLLKLDKFCTFIANGVGYRLCNEAFHRRLVHWQKELGTHRFVAFVKCSIACRLHRLDNMIDFIKLKQDKWTTAMSANFCRIVEIEELSQVQQETWVDIFNSESVALDDDDDDDDDDD